MNRGEETEIERYRRSLKRMEGKEEDLVIIDNLIENFVAYICKCSYIKYFRKTPKLV